MTTETDDHAKVTDHEFVKNHAKEMVPVRRDGWDDNDTPYRFDRNELKLWWGGGENTGLDEHGNFQFDIRHMTEAGSYHAGHHDNPVELMRNDKMEVLLSVSKGTQNQVFRFPVHQDGSVVIPADSPAAKLFSVATDAGGNHHAEWHGAYAEVAVNQGLDEAHHEHVQILATLPGDGMKNLTDSVERQDVSFVTTTSLAVPSQEGYLSPPPVIPIIARHPLEPAKPDEKPHPPVPPVPLEPVPPIPPIPPIMPSPEEEKPTLEGLTPPPERRVIEKLGGIEVTPHDQRLPVRPHEPMPEPKPQPIKVEGPLPQPTPEPKRDGLTWSEAEEQINELIKSGRQTFVTPTTEPLQFLRDAGSLARGLMLQAGIPEAAFMQFGIVREIIDLGLHALDKSRSENGRLASFGKLKGQIQEAAPNHDQWNTILGPGAENVAMRQSEYGHQMQEVNDSPSDAYLATVQERLTTNNVAGFEDADLNPARLVVAVLAHTGLDPADAAEVIASHRPNLPAILNDARIAINVQNMYAGTKLEDLMDWAREQADIIQKRSATSLDNPNLGQKEEAPTQTEERLSTSENRRRTALGASFVDYEVSEAQRQTIMNDQKLQAATNEWIQATSAPRVDDTESPQARQRRELAGKDYGDQLARVISELGIQAKPRKPAIEGIGEPIIPEVEEDAPDLYKLRDRINQTGRIDINLATMIVINPNPPILGGTYLGQPVELHFSAAWSGLMDKYRAQNESLPFNVNRNGLAFSPEEANKTENGEERVKPSHLIIPIDEEPSPLK